MGTELALRKRLDGPAESSGHDLAEFWAPPVAPIETSPPAANAMACVRAPYADENDAPQLSQHTDVSSQRIVGSGRKLITGIAVVLALGLSALAYFFFGHRQARKQPPKLRNSLRAFHTLRRHRLKLLSARHLLLLLPAWHLPRLLPARHPLRLLPVRHLLWLLPVRSLLWLLPMPLPSLCRLLRKLPGAGMSFICSAPA